MVTALSGSKGLYLKHQGKKFASYREAAQEIIDAGGQHLSPPTGIPENWLITICSGFGVKFTNPNDNEEWIKYLPGDETSTIRKCRSPHFIYHQPINTILKRQEAWKASAFDQFDEKDPNHIAIIKDLLKKYPGQSIDQISKRATAAYKSLRNFWFSVSGFLQIRRLLGLRDFPQKPSFMEVYNKIREDLICSCHSIYFAQTQAGMMIKYNLNPLHNNVRLAFHEYEDEAFLKINFSGYRDASGAEENQGETSVHLTFSEVESTNFDWYLTICKRVYSVEEFDYEDCRKMVHPALEKLHEDNRLTVNKNSYGVDYEA